MKIDKRAQDVLDAQKATRTHQVPITDENLEKNDKLAIVLAGMLVFLPILIIMIIIAIIVIML